MYERSLIYHLKYLIVYSKGDWWAATFSYQKIIRSMCHRRRTVFKILTIVANGNILIIYFHLPLPRYLCNRQYNTTYILVCVFLLFAITNTYARRAFYSHKHSHRVLLLINVISYTIIESWMAYV